jgi:hypothetical protein
MMAFTWFSKYHSNNNKRKGFQAKNHELSWLFGLCSLNWAFWLKFDFSAKFGLSWSSN